MERYKRGELSKMVAGGYAIDVTDAVELSAIPESYDQVGYSSGAEGCSGLLLLGRETGRLYAVTKRSKALWLF